jgi:LuxR family transcriptional regulator, maltose regulon positive regulatory protein
MTANARVPFRLRPPDLPLQLVYRSRLLDDLRHRFDRRLTVVRAGAGFGKTTLLAHAVAENQLDPTGIDVWLQLNEGDRQPEYLLAGLSAALVASARGALGADLADPSDPSVGDVIDLVWSLAPEPVAFVLDDVHLVDGSPSMTVIAELCSQLSANGCVVIGSRTTPTIPIRLLQARGEALVLDEADLAFSTAEQADFAHLRRVELPAGEEVPSWPALAVLMSTVGQTATIEYLWDAVLASLPPERRSAMALMVRFGRVDDALVDAVLGAEWTARSLLDGLPLVETRDDEYRFHDLWRAALADSVGTDEWKRALAAGAEVLIERGEISRGARCLQAAGANDRLVTLARSFGSAPISSGLSSAVAEVLLDCLPLKERNGALGRYLRTIETGAFQSERILRDLRGVFSLAADDDPELAALALWRETQLLGDVDPAHLSSAAAAELVGHVERCAADGWPLARFALGLIVSHGAEQRRDVPAAIDAIALFEGGDPAVSRASITSRFLALGHPEQVSVTLDEVLVDGVSEPVSAQAVWLRGEIDPSVAWPIARELPAVYGKRRLPNVQVPLLGVLTSVALAAGDLASARTLANDAIALARRLLPRPASFAHVADALVTLAEVGDAAAASRFEEVFDRVPLGPWPPWSALGALCPIRALLPGAEWLDEIDFGPSVRTAVEAGRAIADLRTDGTAAGAQSLPWGSPDLLRVHVPPSMLTELALAAVDAVPAAQACLDSIPDHIRWVERLVDHSHPQVRVQARALTSGTPTRPRYGLQIVTLGEFSIRRDDGVSVSDRVRGGRVQQLIAELLAEPAPLRTVIAARLWPDLSDKQAGANLRVTLATLLDSIEPVRRPGTSWFVRSEDGRLRLVDDGVDVDVRRFDRLVVAARDAERGARFTEALEQHRSASKLYHGDYMPGINDADVEQERLRLQTLAYNAACRLAELLLAKGEPEDALRASVDAARIDPLAERARRTEIRSHLALGSTMAARETARSIRARLRRELLEPDRETALLLDRADPEGAC